MQQKRAGGPAQDSVGKRFAESPAEYEGVVKSRGGVFGFIDCEVTFAAHGKDVYFNRSTVGAVFTRMKPGTQVNFAAIVGDDGQPRACNVSIPPGGAGDYAEQAALDGGAGRLYVGVVKSKTPKYGFIECAETHGIYGKDIFILPSLIGDDVYSAMQVNSEISFDIVEEQEGPRAIRVQVLSNPAPANFGAGAAPARQPAYTPYTPSYAPAYSPYAPSPYAPQAPGAPHAAAPAPLGRLYDGIVKKQGQKYGFIDSAELSTTYGRDVMFFPSLVGGDSVYAEMTPGTAVRFAVQFEAGQPRAFNVSFPGRAPPQQRGSPAVGMPVRERLFQGVVKSKGDKYAFIESQELKQTFGGKDVFLNPKFVGDEVFNALVSGMAVRFQYVVDKGAPRASSCQIAGPAPPGGGGAAPRTKAAAAPAPVVEQTGLTFAGTVKTRSDKYGFIDSPEAVAQYGKDIFVSPKSVGEEVYGQLDVGRTVVVSVNIEDGKPRAVAVLQVD